MRTRSAFDWVSLAASHAVLLVCTAVFVLPIAFMVVASFKPDDLVLREAGSWRALFPTEMSFQNYFNVFDRVNFGRFFVNSVLITGSIVVGGLLVNSMAAYAFSRMRWRGRDFCFGLVLALLILPFEAIAVPLFYQMIEFGWRNSYRVQIVPFIANAFSIYLFYSFFLQIPKEMEEAAAMDGAGAWRTFFTLIIPLAKPAFATVAILTFLMHWGNYLWPLMVVDHETYRPLPVAIAEFQTLPPIQWGDIMAFGVMMILPVLAVFLIFQKGFVRGVASSGIKS